MKQAKVPSRDHEALYQLIKLLWWLHQRAISGLGKFQVMDVGQRARQLLASMDEVSSNGALSASIIAVDVLSDRERMDPAFWATPLGRAISWQIGWRGENGESVPVAVAAVIAGVSRQRIYALTGAAGQRISMDAEVGERMPAAELARRARALWSMKLQSQAGPAWE